MTLDEVVVDFPIGVNLASTVSRWRLACLSSERPRAVSLTLTLVFPAFLIDWLADAETRRASLGRRRRRGRRGRSCHRRSPPNCRARPARLRPRQSASARAQRRTKRTQAAPAALRRALDVWRRRGAVDAVRVSFCDRGLQRPGIRALRRWRGRGDGHRVAAWAQRLVAREAALEADAVGSAVPVERQRAGDDRPCANGLSPVPDARHRGHAAHAATGACRAKLSVARAASLNTNEKVVPIGGRPRAIRG